MSISSSNPTGNILNALTSSIVKKTITAITGIALVLFAIFHLLGNLTLFYKDPAVFNAYAEKLESLGILFVIAEVGLVALFGIHVLNGIRLKLDHRAARPVGYKQWRSKKGPSKANVSSLYMAVTGIILLAFLILHILQFRLGPGEAQGYVTTLGGLEARDLHRLVLEIFAQPFFVAIYVISVIALGFHLRHGFWSSFQSLGVSSPRVIRGLEKVGILLSILLTVGFAAIPLWIYCQGGLS